MQQRDVEVRGDHNTIQVSAEGHRWIALVRGGEEVIRESGGAATTAFMVEPGNYQVCTDGALGPVRTERQVPPPRPGVAPGLEQRAATGRGPAALRLACDAPEVHSVDGVGEVRADGRSFTTVTVEAVDDQGIRSGEVDEVFLRTTGGKLVDAARGERIRSVRLDSGVARFRLVSDRAPKLVTVHAFAAAATPTGALRAELAVEFV